MKQAVMWSQANCQYCDMAANLLEHAGYETEVRKLGTNATKQELIAVVPNARSVPQIFLDGVHIGGYSELVRHLG